MMKKEKNLTQHEVVLRKFHSNVDSSMVRIALP